MKCSTKSCNDGEAPQLGEAGGVVWFYLWLPRPPQFRRAVQQKQTLVSSLVLSAVSSARSSSHERLYVFLDQTYEYQLTCL